MLYCIFTCIFPVAQQQLTNNINPIAAAQKRTTDQQRKEGSALFPYFLITLSIRLQLRFDWNKGSVVNPKVQRGMWFNLSE